MEDTGKNRAEAACIVGNICALIGILGLGGLHVLTMLTRPDAYFFAVVLGVITLAGVITLIVAYKRVPNYEYLAFFVPLIVFASLTIMQVIYSGGRSWSEFYLAACIACCILSCLYNSYILTILFVVIENIVIGILAMLYVPFMGDGSNEVIYLLDPEIYEGIPTTMFGCAVSIIAGFFLCVGITTMAKKTNAAVESRESFRTLMDTTPNYIAMVDELNIVTNISGTLAKMAHLEHPEWAVGRPVLDLFPSLELKELAGDLLRKTDRIYEEMWEFWLNGEHRYMKALGDDLPDGKGILINLIDMTHLAERDEIAAMKDNLDIGLFFMNREFIIQDNFSKAMPRIMGSTQLFGMNFIELLSYSVSKTELAAIEDYFNMVMEGQFDKEMLADINPLAEFNYFSYESKERKILNVEFTTVDRGHGEIMIMGSIYDVTAQVELQKKLAAEERLRQEEMRSLFELINVESNVFNDYLEDVNYEFGQIDKVLKNHDLDSHQVLVEIYQSIHAIKSNSVILGLATFGEKVHTLESEIKRLRESETVGFDDMLHLTLEIEKLVREKDNFRIMLSRIHSFKSDSSVKSNDDMLVASLKRATEKASADLGKKVDFVVESLDPGIMQHGPRRVMKETLTQLVRNSVVHGVEEPEIRVAKGKSETGVIRLSIKREKNMIHIRLKDDGAGLNYDRIREKVLAKGLITESEANDKNRLLQAIFMPGFSTAESETVHGGRGIGLNLVRDRVKEIGGMVKIQSEPDKGTAFHLYIPLAKEYLEQEKAAS